MTRRSWPRSTASRARGVRRLHGTARRPLGPGCPEYRGSARRRAGVAHHHVRVSTPWSPAAQAGDPVRDADRARQGVAWPRLPRGGTARRRRRTMSRCPSTTTACRLRPRTPTCSDDLVRRWNSVRRSRGCAPRSRRTPPDPQTLARIACAFPSIFRSLQIFVPFVHYFVPGQSIPSVFHDLLVCSAAGVGVGHPLGFHVSMADVLWPRRATVLCLLPSGSAQSADVVTPGVGVRASAWSACFGAAYSRPSIGGSTGSGGLTNAVDLVTLALGLAVETRPTVLPLGDGDPLRRRLPPQPRAQAHQVCDTAPGRTRRPPRVRLPRYAARAVSSDRRRQAHQTSCAACCFKDRGSLLAATPAATPVLYGRGVGYWHLGVLMHRFQTIARVVAVIGGAALSVGPSRQHGSGAARLPSPSASRPSMDFGDLLPVARQASSRPPAGLGPDGRRRHPGLAPAASPRSIRRYTPTSSACGRVST